MSDLPTSFRMFHGAPPATCALIAQHGIISSAMGRWGPGVYGIPSTDANAAENAYRISEHRSGPGGGSAYVVLRVTLPSAPKQLGESKEKDDGARNKIWTAGSAPAAFASHPEWVGCPTFREAVVRNAAHCVVEEIHIKSGRMPSCVAPTVSLFCEGDVTLG